MRWPDADIGGGGEKFGDISEQPLQAGVPPRWEEYREQDRGH